MQAGSAFAHSTVRRAHWSQAHWNRAQGYGGVLRVAGGVEVVWIKGMKVLVYGSTPGGICSALEAVKQGAQVILACPKLHPGGVMASGLCTMDAVRPGLFSGYVQDFLEEVRRCYARELGSNSRELELIRNGLHYEPSVCQRIFEDWLERAGAALEWMPGHRLESAQCVDRNLVSVRLRGRSGETVEIEADGFVDATYEGDLAAAAGVPYRVGREGREAHGEPLAGIIYQDWRKQALIPTPESGEASPAIQAYCARSILTDDPERRAGIERPLSYPEHLEELERMLDDFPGQNPAEWGPGTRLPRRKFELNGSIIHRTSINLPGRNSGWPEAGWEERSRLEALHRDRVLAYCWFLQNDLRVPTEIRAQWEGFGLHRDEFTDFDHLPWQLYVRQGRRIVGRTILTQHHFTVQESTGRTREVGDPIAVGEHSFDVHPCQDRTQAVEGYMEGVLWFPQKADGPAQPAGIPLDAIRPVNRDNLLVPVAMSATHVAFSVVRMEPLWMTTGQAAGRLLGKGIFRP